MKAAVTRKGYLDSSPDKKNDLNIIPSNKITMKGVSQQLQLIPIKFPEGYTGKAVTGKPGKEYNFPGFDAVIEIPKNMMRKGGPSPYSQESQVPVMPYYNTSPEDGFYGIMAYGGTPYSLVSQLPVMNGYNASPRGAMTFYKHGGSHEDICIPCIFENMQHMQQGGGTGYNFDQYYKDLDAWQNPSAQSVPKNIANYESTWIVPTIKNYQTTLNAALSKKYNLQAGQSPAQNQFLSAQEAQTALGGQQQYADYLNYVQGYQAYRNKTSATYQAPSQTAGTMDPNGEAYGYRHFGLFTLSPQQAAANQAAAGPVTQNVAGVTPTMDFGGEFDDEMDLYEMSEGGWIKKASDKMKKKGTKGSFTKYCGGKVTAECIKRGLNSPNPTIRKRAAFAKAMHHIAKKKTGGDMPEQYQGLGYLDRRNRDFINGIAENFGSHMANDEVETLEKLHRRMMQDGGANLPMGTLYSTTSVDPMQPTIELPANPAWDIPHQDVQVPGQYQTVQMDPNQLQGRPITSAPEPMKHRSWFFSMTPEQRGNSILAGTSLVAGMLEKRQRDKQDQLLRRRMGADQVFNPISMSQASRGDYDMNSGAFRPDMMTPVQFSGAGNQGYGYQTYQMGGFTRGNSYYMSDQDIQQFLAAGGEIEYED